MNDKTCPVCRGKGTLPVPFRGIKNQAELKKKMAAVLVHNGFSFRQIMKFLAWRSPGSVSRALGRVKCKK